MALPTFQNSYIITARQQPNATARENIVPLGGGNLWFYWAPGEYNAEAASYTPAATTASTQPPASYQSRLIQDIQAASQLTVIVHGLGNLFATSIMQMSVLGNGLQQFPQSAYDGLVISFDWPSYDLLDSSIYYASGNNFPPEASSGTVRDNINGTAAAFENFLAMLQTIQSKISGLQVNFICHSEGNYMMMLGMYEQLQSKPAQTPFIDQVLLVAADINNGALQSSGPASYTGQGMAISKVSNGVTIYYSSGDDVLPHSQDLKRKDHNPSYPDRLGLEGPDSYSTTATPLAANAYGVDCSAVINQASIEQIPQVPPGTSTHSAYFYIPQVLGDWAAVLTGTAPGDVPNRTANPNAQDGQGFIMQRLLQPPQQPLVRHATLLPSLG